MMNDDRDSTQRDCGGAMAVPCRAVPRFGRTSNRLPWDRVSALAMAGQAKTLDLQVHAASAARARRRAFPSSRTYATAALRSRNYPGLPSPRRGSDTHRRSLR
jgi:hypothetical protein